MGAFSRFLATTAIALPLLGVSAAPEDDRATLARVSSPPILIAACSRLVIALGATTAWNAPAPRDAARDADAAAIVAFLHSRKDVATRGRCARDFAVQTSIRLIELSKTERHSAYGPDAVAAIITLLAAPDAKMRIAATKALYGIQAPPAGPALLRAAQRDADPRVKDAAFRSLRWSMRADVAVNHDAPAYRRAIASALRANDPIIVPGALVALAGLDGLNADRTLRHSARSPNATIRAGAIDAYDTMMPSIRASSAS